MKFNVEIENRGFDKVIKASLCESDKMLMSNEDFEKYEKMAEKDLKEYLYKKVKAELGIDADLQELIHQLLMEEDKYTRVYLYDKITDKIFKN